MAKVQFYSGLYAAYESAVKSDDALYFITDTQQIYKGSTLLSDVTELNVEFVATVPQAGSAEENKLYVVTDGSGIYIKGTDGQMDQVGGGEATSVADGTITFDSLNSELVAQDLNSPANNTIPTTQAVSDAIAAALEGYDAAFTGVSPAPNETPGETGTILTFTRKNGEDSVEVKIPDLFLSNASYDSDSHILTLTVGDSASTVEVNLEDLVPQAVNTSQVAMADEIVINVAGQDGIGNFKNGDTITLEQAADLQTFLVKLMSQDTNPTTTQPSVSVSLTNAGAKEVGSTFTPSWKVTLNPGAYSANKDGAQPTGVEATSYSVTDTNSGSASTQSGSFTEFTVLDNTNYKVSATVQHTAGNVPTTFLGEPYPAGQIAAGSKTGQSSAVTGFRYMFYGRTTDAEALNSAEIRALSGKRAAGKGQLPEIVAQVGDRQVLVAFPSTLTASDPTFEYFTLSWGPFEGFVKSTVQVDGYNAGANATEYTVWSYTAAAPLAAQTRFRITIN